jgi:hypothetical protein
MAEVLVQFDTPITAPDGRRYLARVCGREAADGMWEGWIEFDPQDGSPVLRTPRETEQSARKDLAYWASGLTVAYLEGALERARTPRPARLWPRTVDASPAYEGPAPALAEGEGTDAAPRTRPRAVLDPFAVYAQGEDVLRQELTALDAGHLRNILRDYGLVRESELNLLALSREALAEMIVAAVRQRAG